MSAPRLSVIESSPSVLSHCEERSDVAISKNGISSVSIDFAAISSFSATVAEKLCDT